MNETIGTRIKKLRKERNLTQSQLAEKIFISESYMALIELNKRHPSTDVIIKLAEILDVSSDFILFGHSTDNESILFYEWKNLMHGKTPAEIASAQNLVKCFFENIDKLNRINK